MKQKGFTLIELVVVIVILGILAATALPKFVDLSTDAGGASAEGVAGAIASATAINYAKFQISSGAATTVNNGATCLTFATALATYDTTTVTVAGTLTCTAAGAVGTGCTATHTKGGGAKTISAICTGV